jgi:ribosomal protein S17
VISAFVNHGVTRRVVTGTVVKFKAGESIAVITEGVEPHPIALRETIYEGSSVAIRVGTRVTVWYRFVGESRPVADKVRVLPDAATR